MKYEVHKMAAPPFRAQHFRSGCSAVIASNGFNLVTFPEHPGAVFLTPEEAETIVKELNAK